MSLFFLGLVPDSFNAIAASVFSDRISAAGDATFAALLHSSSRLLHTESVSIINEKFALALPRVLRLLFREPTPDPSLFLLLPQLERAQHGCPLFRRILPNLETGVRFDDG